ncbi:MAG: non-homologous end-joining DNA ligase [Thermoleophilia bacterium]
MTEVLDILSAEEKERLVRADVEFVSPMLATLTHDYFSDPGWIFERKLDGERCVAVCSGGRVSLFSRNQKAIDANYPEVREALERKFRAAGSRGGDFVVDGEIVAFVRGLSSFSALQPRMQAAEPEEARRAGPAIYYYLFDVMRLGGWNTEQVPLRSRKKVLKRMFCFRDPLRFTAHRNEKGEEFHAEACRKGWEGVIAKKADSTYVRRRSKLWLKFKCVNQQEFVIGGFTDPRGSRTGFGALLLGYYEGGEGHALRYAGKVGTGFDETTLKSLRERMGGLETDEPAFAPGEDLPERSVHWVEPELVCEVGFTEWTGDGRLRHPRFLGLRRDKAPEEVRREDRA